MKRSPAIARAQRGAARARRGRLARSGGSPRAAGAVRAQRGQSARSGGTLVLLQRQQSAPAVLDRPQRSSVINAATLITVVQPTGQPAASQRAGGLAGWRAG